VGSYHETRLPIPSAHTRRPFLICAVLSLSWWGIHNNATDTKGKVSVAHQKEANAGKAQATITISSIGLHIHQVSIYTMCQHLA